MSAANPPAGLQELMTVILQQQSRQGERVASLETSSVTIERDLGIIRQHLHDLRADIDLRMAAQSTKMDALLKLRDQGIGAWRALAWIAGLTVAATTLIGWALTHHFTITVN